MAPTFSLGDDGTMDTVIVCNDCGQEIRYTYSGGPDENADDATDDDDTSAYDEFVAWCMEDAAEDHVCEGIDD